MKFRTYLTVARGEKDQLKVVPAELNFGEKDWIMHPNPNVDLCCLPINQVLDGARKAGIVPIILPIPRLGIEGDDKMVKYGQMDQVIMIGYPDALWDRVNNQPIFRRGIIATNPNLDFNGQKEFLIDMPVYNGSSGSPVFIVREGTFVDRRTGKVMVANTPNFHLIGVVYATYQHSVQGQVIPVPIPTTMSLSSMMNIPNNLGLVLRAQRILELNDFIK